MAHVLPCYLALFGVISVTIFPYGIVVGSGYFLFYVLGMFVEVILYSELCPSYYNCVTCHLNKLFI